MASFTQAYNRVLRAEGGYQNDPRDTGNYNSRGQLVGTNLGISAPVYESWIGRPPTEADMRAITEATARAIYRARFWDRIRGDSIRDQAVADILFDGVVNHGVGRGVRLAQKVLNLTQDGVFGDSTLQAVNRANPRKFYNDYREERIRFYRQLAANSSNHAAFLQGWLNRMAKFQDYAAPAAGGALLLIAGAAAWWWYRRKKARA